MARLKGHGESLTSSEDASGEVASGSPLRLDVRFQLSAMRPLIR